MSTSKTLTIFEGPDGSGKSTAAKAYAASNNAIYVHFSAMPQVSKNLGRMYVEAMLPALLGYQDVVFDRCWLSEEPYGIAFRDSQDRLGVASCRMLDRLAMRCGAVVVSCDPGWQLIYQSYLNRKNLEMLDNAEQLKVVSELYQGLPGRTYLPVVDFDYVYGHLSDVEETINAVRFPLHPLSLQSAGNLDAPIVLVGESFAQRKDNDSFYQWPFASFSEQGCSQWLANYLELSLIPEDDLLWVNCDQNLSLINNLETPGRVIALGNTAHERLHNKWGINTTAIHHPQYHKRFHEQVSTYPLADHIKEALR